MGVVVIREVCVRVTFVAGYRPPTDPREETALREGQILWHFADQLVLVGTGGGGFAEYAMPIFNIVPGLGP